MIEQLAQHGVIPADLTPSLLKSAKVKNPMAQSQNETDAKPAEMQAAAEDATAEPPTTVDSTGPQTAKDLHVQSPEDFKNLETIEIDVRWTILCDLFLVLISDSIYDARSRTLLENVAKELHISILEVAQFEGKVTDALQIEEGSIQTWDESEIMESRRKAALKRKYMYIGLATLGGGLVIGLSAGLLAPVIGAGLAAGFTTIGVTGTGTFLAGAGGAAVVTSTGVAVGAHIGSKGMAKRMGHVKTFEIRPLHNHKRVNVIVTVSGWMSGKEDDVRLPFSTIDPVMGDLLSVLWEPEMLQSMGQTINILATEVLTQSIQQVLGQTVLVALMASIQLPMVLSKLGYLLDNPWNVSLDRAWAAGLVLADTLINRNIGVRPVILVGFSLGARVIYSCLVELARRGAYGLVQDVYLFGAPVVVKRNQLALARCVVSGRFVNGYSKKDWILGYLFRATSGGLGRIGGLASLDSVANIENIDCTELVEGHMGYRKAIPKLLSSVGWEVFSDEFTEIEDPDPEKLREKQQELIVEFDEARKQMEKEAKQDKSGKKSRFFSWMKPKKKEWWEMAESVAHDQGPGSPSSPAEGVQSGNVMFDLDAIKQEVENIEQQNSGKQNLNDLPATLPVSAVTTEEFEEYDDPALHIKPEEIQMSFDAFEDDEAERHGITSTEMKDSPPSVRLSPVTDQITAGAEAEHDGYPHDEFAEESEITMVFD
jgi:hypothetical protein